MISGTIFIIKNNFDRFLLEQRSVNSRYDPWTWVFPGGKREDTDQDHFDIFVREAKEEFGLQIKKEDIKEIGQIIRKNPEYDAEFLSICLVEINNPDRLVIEESAGGGWFTLEEVRNIQLGYNQHERVLPILEKFLASV